MEVLAVNIIEYQEFNKLIRELGVNDYRGELDNDWHNDSAYLFRDVSNDELDNESRDELLSAIDDGGKIWDYMDSGGTGYGTENYNAREWLCLFVERGIIPPGDYLINVCW